MGVWVMRLLRVGLAGVTGLLMAATAQAQISEPLANSLMREAGVQRQIEAFAPQMRSSIAGLAQVDASEARLQPEEVARLQAAAQVAFAPEPLLSLARATMAKALTPHHARVVQAWLGTAVGQRVTQLEHAAAAAASGDSVDQNERLRRGAVRLREATEARQRLLEDMALYTRSGESLARLVMGTTLAIQRGVAASRPDLPSPPVQAMRQAMQLQMGQMSRAFHHAAVALFADLYSTLEDEDLNTYLGFLRSAEARHFNDVAVDAMERALMEGSERLGQALRGALGSGQS